VSRTIYGSELGNDEVTWNASNRKRHQGRRREREKEKRKREKGRGTEIVSNE